MTSFGSRRSDEPLNDVFSAYNAVAADVAATVVTLPIDTEHVVSGATFELANGEVTVKVAGNYELTFGSTLWMPAGSGSDRTQGQAWLERNAVELPGTRCMHYCRLQHFGATGSAQIFAYVSVDDVLRIRAQRTAGTGVMSALASGSRLALRRL